MEKSDQDKITRRLANNIMKRPTINDVSGYAINGLNHDFIIFDEAHNLNFKIKAAE